MFSPKAAVTRLAARIKQNLISGIDKLQRLSALHAREDLFRTIHTKLADGHTPGAFGRIPKPHSRPQFRGNKLARVIANGGKVRGF